MEAFALSAEVISVIVVGAGVLLGVWRMVEAVRRDLSKRIDDVNRCVDDVRQGLTMRTDVIGRDVASIARDVSFLAGRQAERDAIHGPLPHGADRTRPTTPPTFDEH